MTEPTRELARTFMKDGKIYFGERELTNLIWTLIRVYRFRNQSKDPKAIVFPDVKEVGGVKVEFTINEIIVEPEITKQPKKIKEE